MTGNLTTLENRIGYYFKDRSILEKAVTHSSSNRALNTYWESNERMEFLGDRVLGLIIANLLFFHFENEEEGALSQRLTALVRMESLTRVARQINLGSFLIISKGEEEIGGREKPGLLANACEALIAALFLDGGLETACQFVENNWAEILAEDSIPPKDAKSALQEWTQARNLGLPEYIVTDQSGPPHAPKFTVAVKVEGRFEEPTAIGSSKQRAEQHVAATMLNIISDDESRS